MKTSILLLIHVIVITTLTNCSENIEESDTCIEGVVSEDTRYLVLLNGCYSKTVWIEVTNQNDLGKNVELHMLMNAYDVPPRELPTYKNVIAIPSIDIDSTILPNLYGKKIFMQLKQPSEKELNQTTIDSCYDYYNAYQIPLYVLRRFSVDQCPSELD